MYSGGFTRANRVMLLARRDIVADRALRAVKLSQTECIPPSVTVYLLRRDWNSRSDS